MEDKKNKYFIAFVYGCFVYLFLVGYVYGMNIKVHDDRLKVKLLAKSLGQARQLAYDGRNNRVFVGTKNFTERIYILDLNDDFTVKTKRHITMMGEVSGVALDGDDLYIGGVSTIWVIKNVNELLNSNRNIKKNMKVLLNDLPSDRHHGRKYLLTDGRGSLYTSVGVPCNVCIPQKVFGTMIKIDTQTGQHDVIARGIRSSVGFDIHPVSGFVWFSDNGRDLMGDRLPPDELNVITRNGLHFGFPFVHGTSVNDPVFYKRRNVNQSYERPIFNFGPHEAVLGIHFYKGNGLPKEYHGGLFVAKHGSWNSSKKVGYTVTFLKIQNNKVLLEKDFLTGFLKSDGKTVIGRPVDITELRDGSLLVSDDYKEGAIYRVY